jgi:hypothetical protein
MSPHRRSPLRAPSIAADPRAASRGATAAGTTGARVSSRSLAVLAASLLLAACADGAPLAPDAPLAASARRGPPAAGAEHRALATLRRATARYHDVRAAVADGFVLLHECEVRPGEGPVGILYVHMGRLLDGAIDPALPDALLYEPARRGRPKLVGVELAVPYALWSGAAPPAFLGAEFQREEEFGVFALHVWVWRHNPEGMFAEANPRVSCGET